MNTTAATQIAIPIAILTVNVSPNRSVLIKIVMMDIYDCRDEYEFYERFASSVLRGLATKAEQAMTIAKKLSLPNSRG